MNPKKLEELIKKGFFKNLKIDRFPVDESLNKPRFEKEDWQNGYRVYTKRFDGSERVFFTVTLFSGPQPKDFVDQIISSNYKRAMNIHYSALKALKDKNDVFI